MGQKRPDIELTLLEALEKRTPQERATYLDQVCGNDARMRAELNSLLEFHQQAGSFLEASPLAQNVTLGESPIAEGPGTLIGRYKLLEKIGEGGMAVVYMAEQQEPIRRKVALKIIKLGMDTRQVIARFEAERQALALMDHSSIAKVLDAGATETGRPYFVMELVTGVSITEYCDKNSLSTKDRLALFLQVCHAVQHAHQKGIIHRDIKPSNVMVTHHDGQPVPKVIDFGIAKATNQKLTEKTLFTRYAHLIGTPAYMSPEQAELSDLDIDTRSDIYSLGVLLYELLTGTTPFSEQELRKAGYVEMQRVIREQEPVKPSTRIRTAQLRGEGILPLRVAGILPALRGRPRTEGPLHIPLDTQETKAKMASGRKGETPSPRLPYHRSTYEQVRGDLDWIVMKSLEKDRARRYETASGLAEDIRRHLEHEPVLARGPSTTYRLRKCLRRHRVPVVVGMMVAVLIAVVAVVLSVWKQDRLQWQRDRLQLAQAQELQDKAMLDQAHDQYGRGERDAALETIRPLLRSPRVGGKARLLQAGILVDNRRPEEAVSILNGLLDEPREIAGAAHALLARVFWESQSPNAEKLQQIEEHRRRAEELLPDTAEAYFLRAMTAPTIREQLVALDRALELDPKHYESRRLRAFTYYASRKYERLNEDALLLEAGRERDPLGYSLRATALGELGRYQEALAGYDHALARTPKDDPQRLELATQRSETLLRMGSYERVIAASQEALRLWPDRPVFQYHLFCALTALGDYDKADTVFQAIARSAPTARNEFRFWATKHVLDTLGAGRSWHPPEHEPVGAAFLPLMEAEETYWGLSRKARRVIPDGFSAQWSPDGKKLAFSMGVHGYSGVATYDPARKETELLIVPGQHPRWSPDGRHIAFVRHCQALQLGALTTPERQDQMRWPEDEEVWIMKTDGSDARRLARGGWPCWSRDSAHVYYQSRLEGALCTVSIEDRDARPRQIMACSNPYPSVSPDERRMAYLDGTFLKVMDISSQALIAEWPAPASAWGGPAWSSSGDELCLGGSGGGENRTGLWVYRFDKKEPVRVLDGQLTVASWAPDGTKLVFGLGAYSEIWAADLDRNVSALESLGPSRTLDEHFRDMVALCTRRITADPLDAYAYSSRAGYYDRLHERARSHADIRLWSALVSHGISSGFRLDRPWTVVRPVTGPLGYQLVVFLERQEDGLHVLRIACGQKGRCEMKMFEVPMVIASLVSICFLSGPSAPPAHADFTFDQPTNLGPAISTPDKEYTFVISRDGLESYSSSGIGTWVSRRATVESVWGPRHLLIGDSTGAWCLSADELTLYFSAPTGSNAVDVAVMTRTSKSENWGPLVNLGAPVNTVSWDWAPSLPADGLELYFTSDRPGGYGSMDLYVAKRTGPDAPWGTPVNLGPTINSSAWDESPAISPDGLVLIFSSQRTGGYAGSGDLYMARRATTKDAWGPPVNLGPLVNSTSGESNPMISLDGTVLYFVSNRPGGYGGSDAYQVLIIPIVDFSGDGKVDAADMALFVANWGKNTSLCDIGPFPWGDGVVDERDLRVLMESLMTPGPKATDVPCDVVLSWMSPSFAQTQDIYLGTSFEAVNTASRANPQGVLASQGQTATIYDPPGSLEFSKTYYWRVDFVISSPAPAIYQGPVLKFTTEAYARPLKNITVTASSFQRGMEPAKTVDGSGLDKNDGHSTTGSDMWLSQGVQPNWIQYAFDRVYTLHELWVWNQNQPVEPFIGFGAKTVKIEYSTDGTAWTALANVPEFAKASGKPDYTHNTTVSFGGVSAKYVKLTIEKGWGATPSVGLSEVRFFYIPDRSTPKP